MFYKISRAYIYAHVYARAFLILYVSSVMCIRYDVGQCKSSYSLSLVSIVFIVDKYMVYCS